MAEKVSITGLHRLALLLREKTPGVNISTLNRALFHPATPPVQKAAILEVTHLLAELHAQGHDLASVLYAVGPAVGELIGRVEELEGRFAQIQRDLGVSTVDEACQAAQRLANAPAMDRALYHMLGVQDASAAVSALARLQTLLPVLGAADVEEARGRVLQLDMAAGRLDETFEELDEMVGQLEHANAQIVVLEEQLREANEEVGRLRAESSSNADLAERLRQAGDKVEDLERQVANFNEQVHLMGENLKKADDKEQEAQRQREAFEELLNIILANEAASYPETLRERIGRAKSKMDGMLLELETLREEIRNMQAEAARTTAQFRAIGGDNGRIVLLNSDTPVIETDNGRFALLTHRGGQSNSSEDAVGRLGLAEGKEIFAVGGGMGFGSHGGVMSSTAVAAYLEARRNGSNIPVAIAQANISVIRAIETILGREIPRNNAPLKGTAFSVLEIDWHNKMLCVVSVGNIRVKYVFGDPLMPAVLLTRDHTQGWYEYTQRRDAQNFYPKADRTYGIPDALVDRIDANGRNSMLTSYLGSGNGIGGVVVEPLITDVMLVPFERAQQSSALLLYTPAVVRHASEAALTQIIQGSIAGTPQAMAELLYRRAREAKAPGNPSLALLKVDFVPLMGRADISHARYRGMSQ